jgi:hypothetical protein
MEPYIIIAIILLIALWNGLIIVWGLQPTKNKKLQTLWHGVGFVIRGLLSLLIYIQFGMFYFWISVILNWHAYDIIINVVRGLKWSHTGQNFFDKSPWCWMGKGIILIAGLLFLI